QQVRGLFDLPPEKTSRVEWTVDLPLDARPWNIGLIVGPSGCGKTTIARHLFPGARIHLPEADARDDGQSQSPFDACASTLVKSSAIVAAFPASLSIRDIALLLSSVGFASPPAWLRPFNVLSTGQKFRGALAWLLAATPPDQTIVFDEYTSVVDRTVAQIG